MEKEINGYFVDSRGFVWNKKHTAPLKGKFDKNGYQTVCLFNNGEKQYMGVHRLVAMAFVDNPNPDKYNIVNHLDGNKNNNNPNNLEWTDVSGNTKHATKMGLNKTPNTSITTFILDKNTNTIKVFQSRKECEEYYGAEYRSITGSRKCKRFSHLEEVSCPYEYSIKN